MGQHQIENSQNGLARIENSWNGPAQFGNSRNGPAPIRNSSNGLAHSRNCKYQSNEDEYYMYVNDLSSLYLLYLCGPACQYIHTWKRIRKILASSSFNIKSHCLPCFRSISLNYHTFIFLSFQIQNGESSSCSPL